MPVLSLPDNSPVTAWCALIMAVAYPDEPGRHPDFAKAVAGKLAVDCVNAGVAKPAGDGKLFTELVQADTALPLQIDALTARRDKGRQMAAELLLTTLSLHRYAPEIASQERAIELIQQRNAQKKGATSRASVMAAWTRYKSVAHILAAFHLREAEMDALDQVLGSGADLSLEKIFAVGGQDNGAADEIDLTALLAELSQMMERFAKVPVLMAEFVALAQQIGLDATRAFSHGQKKRGHPLANSVDLWLLPDDLELPEVTVDYPPLSAEDRRRLGL